MSADVDSPIRRGQPRLRRLFAGGGVALLAISLTSVRRLIESGDLIAIRLGERRVVIPKERLLRTGVVR